MKSKGLNKKELRILARDLVLKFGLNKAQEIVRNKLDYGYGLIPRVCPLCVMYDPSMQPDAERNIRTSCKNCLYAKKSKKEELTMAESKRLYPCLIYLYRFKGEIKYDKYSEYRKQRTKDYTYVLEQLPKVVVQ